MSLCTSTTACLTGLHALVVLDFHSCSLRTFIGCIHHQTWHAMTAWPMMYHHGASKTHPVIWPATSLGCLFSSMMMSGSPVAAATVCLWHGFRLVRALDANASLAVLSLTADLIWLQAALFASICTGVFHCWDTEINDAPIATNHPFFPINSQPLYVASDLHSKLQF